MLSSTEKFFVTNGLMHTNAINREGWTNMGSGLQMAHLFLGDPVSGPFVQVGRAPMLPAGPVHMHRADTFRIGLEGTFNVGKFCYEAGDFRLQGAGRYYGPESGPAHHTLLLIMADRRGWIPVPASEKEKEVMQPMIDATAGFYAGHIPVVLPDSSTGVTGLADSISLYYRAGRANGSFSKTDSWELSPDGIRYCMLLLGDRLTGPLLLLSDAPARTVESAPAFGTDSCRVIISGSAAWGGRIYERGDVCAVTADASPAEVAHGGEGSRMLTVYADRSACTVNIMNAGTHWINSRLQALMN